MNGMEMAVPEKAIDFLDTIDEHREEHEVPRGEPRDAPDIDLPDLDYIERTPYYAIREQNEAAIRKGAVGDSADEVDETSQQGLTEEQKAEIKEETGWSDEIIDNIENMDQYEILKNAGLKEVEINGRKCLIKENIDLDYIDEDGISNRKRMERGLAPLDSKTGNPIELHHLGQKVDSPLVELTEEEHRTGEYQDGKKNQSLWHDNTKATEVHGEGNEWSKERGDHWKERGKDI